MLRLFQSMFGHAREGQTGAAGGLGGEAAFDGIGMGTRRGTRPSEDDEFNSMYS